MRAIQESMPTPDGSSTPDLIRDDGSSQQHSFGYSTAYAPASVSVRPKSPTNPSNTQRSASAPVVSSPAPPSRSDSRPSMDTSTHASSATVSSFNYSKAWEVDAENALKVRKLVEVGLRRRTFIVKSVRTGSSSQLEGTIASLVTDPMILDAEALSAVRHSGAMTASTYLSEVA